ncbi:hypothetical protein H5410_045993 [Solanum commersonii]|uniref:Uncharacterized protein n=1 Tax=Solanum commersonii TaxID=4109 RepID=A0A9J5XD82_SOLCO|nr:hypothetical protein H5410_045993 [Solanum commersonii]
MEPEQYFDEAPNEAARRFYDQLEESSRPLCEGSPHSALINRPNRNDEGVIDPLFPLISIFNQNDRGSKKRRKRGFTDMEMQSAVTHILLNCPEIQSYVKCHQAVMDRHHEHLGVSQTKQAKKKKSKRPIDPKDIAGSISSALERISHDTHLFDVLFGYSSSTTLMAGTPSPTCTSPQLSAMRLGDSSDEQSDVMAGTPPLTQHFVHSDVSPSSTATPCAIPHDTMSALAPGQKDRLGRVMIELDGSS